MRIFLFFISCIVHINSLRLPFLLRQNSQQASTSTANQILEWDQDQISRSNKEMTSKTIHFIGRTLLSSEPFVMPKENWSLNSFFARGHTRNLIFAEQSNVRDVGENGRIEVDTTVASIQGLNISTTAVIDTEVRLDSIEYPAFTFELVDSTLSASGAPPLVYLFEKLCSRKRKGFSVKESISTKSKTTISCQSITSDHMTFIGDATIKISILVPEYVLKLINIQDIEEQGCKAMTRYLEIQVGSALSRLRDAYILETTAVLDM